MLTILRLLLFAFLFRFFLAFLVWHPDINNHIDWGIRFWEHGPSRFYTANVWSFDWPNQPPGTAVIFALMRKLYEIVFAFFWWINITIPLFPSNIMLFFEERLYPVFLKLPGIIADLGIAALIFSFFKGQKRVRLGVLGAGIFLFNPVVWYNSSLWGQTDSVVNFFGLLSILALINKRITWALLSIALSLFIKASLIILLPIILIVLIGQRHSLSEWKKAIFITVLVIGVLTLPFSQGEPVSWLFNLYQKKIFGNRLELVSANAFNFWALLTGIHARSHELLLGPLPFKIWGNLLFGATLLPILIFLFKKQNTDTILWSSFLVLFSSFIFLTGTHERYLYPIFPLLTILAIKDFKLFAPLVVLSILHFLNLYNFWWYPRIEWLVSVLSVGDRVLPRLLGLAATLIFLRSYFKFFKIKTRLNA